LSYICEWVDIQGRALWLPYKKDGSILVKIGDTCVYSLEELTGLSGCPLWKSFQSFSL
jgi:hypothetical protein